MSNNSEFARNLSIGRKGEEIVELWLHKQNYFTLPAYAYTNGESCAPALQCGTLRYVVPDILFSTDNGSFWLEVKTNSHAVENKKQKCMVHGFKLRLYRNYLEVERKTRIPVYLAVLERDTRELLIGELSKLTVYPCTCRGCQTNKSCTAWPVRELVYFPRNELRHKHTFTEFDLYELEEEVACATE